MGEDDDDNAGRFYVFPREDVMTRLYDMDAPDKETAAREVMLDPRMRGADVVVLTHEEWQAAQFRMIAAPRSWKVTPDG